MRKIALVTGSSRGIGKAIALRLAKSGHRVIVHGSKMSVDLENVEKEIRGINGHLMTVCFDIGNQEEVENACSHILKKISRVDVLVNNAGKSLDSSFNAMTFSDWDTVIKTNLYGPFSVTKKLLPKMEESGFGRIINISSIAVKGAYGKTNYVSAKAGIIGFTKSLALEVAKYGVTVNAVCPGYIQTEMSSRIPIKYQKKFLSEIAMERIGTPLEVANVVNFLACDESSYVTGAVIDVNGGWI